MHAHLSSIVKNQASPAWVMSSSRVVEEREWNLFWSSGVKTTSALITQLLLFRSMHVAAMLKSASANNRSAEDSFLQLVDGAPLGIRHGHAYVASLVRLLFFRAISEVHTRDRARVGQISGQGGVPPSYPCFAHVHCIQRS